MVINDRYAEARIVCKKYPKGMLIRAGIILATIVLAFIGLTMGNLLMGSVFMICGIGIFFLYFGLWKYTTIEYEYLFLAGEFSVDKIYGAASRKQAVNLEFSQVELVAAADSDRVALYKNNPNCKVMDFTSGDLSKRRYSMIANHKENKLHLILEPTTEMLELFYLSSPSKVFLEREDAELIRNAARL